jgi:hypothetical protein
MPPLLAAGTFTVCSVEIWIFFILSPQDNKWETMGEKMKRLRKVLWTKGGGAMVTLFYPVISAEVLGLFISLQDS